METHQPIVSYAPDVISLGMAIAVGLAWPTGSKIVYLKTNSDLLVRLPESYNPSRPHVMWRVEIRTTGRREQDRTVADVKAALQTLARVDASSIAGLHVGPNGDGLYHSQVFFNLRPDAAGESEK